MVEIFKQYGESIITVVAIVALIGVIVVVTKSSATTDAFSSLISTFFEKATTAAGM